MFNSLWVAKTGMEAQDFRVQTISNNLANASTTGFKKTLAHFSELGYTHIRGAANGQTQDGATNLENLYTGMGVKVADTSKVFTQGDVNQTDNPLDLMIGGNGFFALQQISPNGTTETVYTRDGHFQLKALNGGGGQSPTEWELLSRRGWQVLDETGEPVVLRLANGNNELGALEISEDGEIREVLPPEGTASYNLIDGTIDGTGRKLGIANFADASGMMPIGGNMFRDIPAITGGAELGAPKEDARGNVLAGRLETSNVSTIEEMVNMIEAQRGYELGAKVMQKADEMMSALIQRT